jgi:hypothetical protein
VSGNKSRSAGAISAFLITILVVFSMIERRIVKEGATNILVGKPPNVRLAVFNAIGILVALSSPLIIERKLTTLKIVFTKAWPWDGTWTVCIALAIFCAAVVAIGTYFCLDRNWSSDRNVWVAPLWVGASIFALSWFFRWGQWPHLGMWCWAIAFSVVTRVLVVFRKERRETIMREDVEHLKATISTWQLITVYGFTAYIAYAISQLYLVWLMSEKLLVSEEERLLFVVCTACQMVIFSALVFMGPLREAWQITFKSVERLGEVNRPESG